MLNVSLTVQKTKQFCNCAKQHWKMVQALEELAQQPLYCLPPIPPRCLQQQVMETNIRTCFYSFKAFPLKSWELSVPNPFPKDTEFASFCLLPEREETCHHCSACAPSQPLLLSCRRGFAPHCTEVALLCDAFAVDGATAPTPNVFLLPPPPPKDI